MLRNMKFRVSSPAQSEALQRTLQSLGYDWAWTAYKGTVQFPKRPLVYTDSEGNMYSSEGGGHEDADSEEAVDTEHFIELYNLNADNIREAGRSKANDILAANAKLSARSLEDAYDDKSSENFFETAKQPDESACPWLDNYGGMPVDGEIVVDVLLRDGKEWSDNAKCYHWEVYNGEYDILKWRYHKAEDYFKAPRTRAAEGRGEAARSSYQRAILENVPVDGCLEVTGDVSLSFEPPKRNKYMREIKPGVWVDVYDVLRAFEVTDGALAHQVKKCLAVGKRGHKDAHEDYRDIKASAARALEIYEEWNV